MERTVTRNVYAPPAARVADTPRPSAALGRIWARFYLSPMGRTGRLFYWLLGFVPLTVVGFGLAILVLRTQEPRYFLIAAVLLFWPQAVILARRLHDINLTGWWVILYWVIPIALVFLHIPLPQGSGVMGTWLAAIILGFIPGTRGPNRYGNDPRGNPSVARSQPS